VTALWQRGMIRLARSERLTELVQGRHLLAGLAGRFVAGSDLDSAVSVAQGLHQQGIGVTLFWLGEYVEDPALVAETARQLRSAAGVLAAAELDVHLSVDPPQAGMMTSVQECERNVRAIAESVAAARHPQARCDQDVLMLGMEDSATTQATLDLHGRLRADGLPLAVTVQAYLHRTTADLQRLSGSGAWVRLVKGALAEPAAVAASTRAEIDDRYQAGLAVLLSPEAREAGCRPSVATHDLRMIVAATTLARRNGWPADRFELEMLYGVRPDLQLALARRGYRVRVYLPFGRAWFPYAVRRVGESPRNVRFALTSVAGSRLRAPVLADAGTRSSCRTPARPGPARAGA
jgi:proline dehydrogenase